VVKNLKKDKNFVLNAGQSRSCNRWPGFVVLAERN
jgi:hypothetical protein